MIVDENKSYNVHTKINLKYYLPSKKRFDNDCIFGTTSSSPALYGYNMDGDYIIGVITRGEGTTMHLHPLAKFSESKGIFLRLLKLIFNPIFIRLY